MGSWAFWRNTSANHNYNLYHMVCISVQVSGTFGTSTNFLCTRQCLAAGTSRVLSRQKLPNLYQVFPSLFGEDTHDPGNGARAPFPKLPRNHEASKHRRPETYSASIVPRLL